MCEAAEDEAEDLGRDPWEIRLRGAAADGKLCKGPEVDVLPIKNGKLDAMISDVPLATAPGESVRGETRPNGQRGGKEGKGRSG